MNELYHHGIKGMKWGVRRYQNKDGTLTAAGRKKYGSEENYKRYTDAKANVKSKRSALTTANDASKAKNEYKQAKQELKDAKKQLPGMSTKKKVAIGVGAAAVVAGTAFVAYKYRKGIKEASRQYSEAGKKYYAKAVDHRRQYHHSTFYADYAYSEGNHRTANRYGESAYKHKEFYDLTDAMAKNANARAQHPSIKDAYRAARGKSVTGGYDFDYGRAGNGDTDLGLANYIAKGYKADTKKRLDRKGTMKQVVLPSAAVLGGIGVGTHAVVRGIDKGIRKGDQKAYEKYKKDHPNTKLSDDEIRYITSQGRRSKSRR